MGQPIIKITACQVKKTTINWDTSFIFEKGGRKGDNDLLILIDYSTIIRPFPSGGMLMSRPRDLGMSQCIRKNPFFFT